MAGSPSIGQADKSFTWVLLSGLGSLYGNILVIGSPVVLSEMSF
ncbi:hypothetical protein [Brevibacillus laterosporus]|nr:hypothetical protein [Brevibacillus laterosporus]MED1663046.1 hypothetical protein [Brevibacillus laterosporus]MED1668896.1 hypothetical protein [Brevibacillus laterosporus]MED1716477.1 hypothetical protein [Brevibacillus laterosporus]